MRTNFEIGHSDLRRCRRFGTAALLGLLLMSANDAATATDFFVARNGNDAWGGTRPEPAANKTDGPFASLERARDAIRALKKSGQLTHGATVHIRGGVYELCAPSRSWPRIPAAERTRRLCSQRG